MTYIAAEARQELLDVVAEAIDELAVALAALGDAFEQLDERSADRLEEELFRPVQSAYGRALRTYTEFAARYDLKTRSFSPTLPGAASRGVHGFLELATEAVDEAENILVVLQDSMRPVEVGDAELRAGLAEVRTLSGELSGRTREFVRVLGR
jgi:hypothetical protein